MKRSRLHNAQQGRCFYCLRYVPFDFATLDHLEPRSEGGNHTAGNLVMACQWCNKVRATDDPIDFKEKVNKMLRGGVSIGPVDCNYRARERNEARREQAYQHRATGEEE